MNSFILILDAGTHTIRARLYDQNGIRSFSVKEPILCMSPKPQWIEQNPMQVWAIQISLARQVMEQNDVRIEQISAIGVTNQRESIVLWEKATGRPVYNIVIWYDRRTIGVCEEMLNEKVEKQVQKISGLKIDPFFSASKIQWVLDNVPGLRLRADKGEILFGTVDSWIVWHLTKGKLHITDYTNASRTLLFNIQTLDWDESLLKLFRIPSSILPLVRPSAEIHGMTDVSIFGKEIPIACIIADQQASLFGNNCLKKGDIKNSYGVGNFILMNTGNERFATKNGTLRTIAWAIKDKVEYAQEGSIFVGGLAIQWIKDQLRLIHTADDSAYYASRIKDSGGVYLVPSFFGLGAPYWNMRSKGIFLGMTFDSNIYHLVRATLDAICYQSRDVIEAIEKDTEMVVKTLHVDGGAAENDFLLQLQSDIAKVPIIRPQNLDTTSQGVAWLVGIIIGMWDKEAIDHMYTIQHTFHPNGEKEYYTEKEYAGWKEAVSLARCWGMQCEMRNKEFMKKIPALVSSKQCLQVTDDTSIMRKISSGKRHLAI